MSYDFDDHEFCDENENCCHHDQGGSTAVPLPPVHDFLPFTPPSDGDTGETNEASGYPKGDYQLVIEPKVVMSPKRMDKLMLDFFNHLMSKCQRKNKAYAETDATSDALNNFREAAADYDISMTKYAHILQGKHYRAFKTFMRTGDSPDLPYRILGDVIVYAFLMYCIGVDEGTWNHEEVLEDGD